MVDGLYVNLHLDIAIPMPATLQKNSTATTTTNNNNTTGPGGFTPEEGSGQGLASAFTLLEIAHTHFFPLPRRGQSTAAAQPPAASLSAAKKAHSSESSLYAVSGGGGDKEIAVCRSSLSVCIIHSVSWGG